MQMRPVILTGLLSKAVLAMALFCAMDASAEGLRDVTRFTCKVEGKDPANANFFGNYNSAPVIGDEIMLDLSKGQIDDIRFDSGHFLPIQAAHAPLFKRYIAIDPAITGGEDVKAIFFEGGFRSVTTSYTMSLQGAYSAFDSTVQLIFQILAQRVPEQILAGLVTPSQLYRVHTLDLQCTPRL